MTWMLFRLALQSALSRRGTLALTLISVALGAALLLGVERIRSDARTSFTQSVSGVDLIVGPRGGNMQLMLYAVFHTGSATNTMRWTSFQEIAAHPAVAWAIPLSLGDSHRGYPVLGTDKSFFDFFRHGNGSRLTLARGRVFERPLEAVIGHDIATRLGYRPGDEIILSHGDTPGLNTDHGDKPFSVVGVLMPTGTPVDRTIHVSLESMTAIHLDWASGVPIPGAQVPRAQIDKFDLTPREITAVFVALRQRSAVFRMQRFIAAYPGEPLSGVLPGVTLDELWASLDLFETSLQHISLLVVLVSLSGLAATLLAGLGARRRELAVLRALGAGPRHLFALLLAEGILMTAIGSLLGLSLVEIAVWAARDQLEQTAGVALQSFSPGAGEWARLGAILAIGFFASLIPAWRALRMSLADGLTPHG